MGNSFSTKKIYKKRPADMESTNILAVQRKNKKNLICDDAYTNRLVLKKYLIRFGCDVDEAENGMDAINKIKDNGEYSIIWMDIKMPKMDGQECTKILRNDMNYKGTIIGLTGYVDSTSIKKCLDLGMNQVVPKPFNYKVIQAYVDNHIDDT
jgi:osomolarity two-component system, sensor histidine kinase SLN1